MNQPASHGEHAVVIGASMGGLVAAAAVAPYFDRVTVLDRDGLPAVPAPRKGVPQGRHAHGFQPGGLQALDVLLPGTHDLLVAGGAPVGDTGRDCSWYVGGGTFARAESGIPTMGLTRPFVEHVVRTQVAALPNVEIRDHVEVLGPIGRDGVVTGVSLAGTLEPLTADLVIDASGRASRLPEWLEELGLPVPAEDEVHCKMAYLSRRWMLSSGEVGNDVLRVCTPDETPRFGVCIAQEDGSHIITVGGLLNSGPERTDEDYLIFASALPSGNFGELLRGATPVTDLVSSHFGFSRRRRYDALKQHPSGLIALGDSVASFNPMYGQGMSVAALEAVALRDLLGRGPLDPRRYYKAIHRIEDVAWKISTGGDLKFDEVEGKRTPDMKVMNGYLDTFALAARVDPELGHQFNRVAGLLEPPPSFFKPSILLRVVRGARKARRLAATTTPAPSAVPASR